MTEPGSTHGPFCSFLAWLPQKLCGWSIMFLRNDAKLAAFSRSVIFVVDTRARNLINELERQRYRYLNFTCGSGRPEVKCGVAALNQATDGVPWGRSAGRNVRLHGSTCHRTTSGLYSSRGRVPTLRMMESWRRFIQALQFRRVAN